MCQIDDCNKPTVARGLCVKHYGRWRRHRDPYYQRPEAQCGTRAGYARHLRFDEQACPSCAAANYEYTKQFRNTEIAKAKRATAWAQRSSAKKLSTEDKDLSISYRLAIANDPCYYCGKRKQKMEVDHKIPIVRGGTDHWWNLCLACSSCNIVKYSLTADEFKTLLASGVKITRKLIRTYQ